MEKSRLAVEAERVTRAGLQRERPATLSAFLLERLDEAAAKAHAMADLGWWPGRDDPDFGDHCDDDVLSAYFDGPGDPVRLLAECEAKRRIVELVAEDLPGWCIDSGAIGDLQILVLGYLALPYANHPDYNPKWRPTT